MADHTTTPDDGSEPLSWAWLQGTDQFKAGIPATFAGHFQIDYRPHDGMVFVEGKEARHIKTRGQLRELFKMLSGSIPAF